MAKLSPELQYYEAEDRVLEGEVLDKDDEAILRQGLMPRIPEIGAVINKALRAAGLIKD